MIIVAFNISHAKHETMENVPFTSRELRDALSSFATGVTIVTTSNDENEPVGMTASSFNSVSMDPPLVLWSIGKTTLSAPIFTQAKHFSVHILKANQIELSNAFSKSGTNKFSAADYTMSSKNVPHLQEVLTRFDCKTWNVYEGGDHWVILGEVENIFKEGGDGLVFSSGSYASANPIAPPEQFSPTPAGSEEQIESLLIYNLSRAYKQMGNSFHSAVNSCGLSVAEWRILASLHGGVTRHFSDLVARTFVDPAGLNDMLIAMSNEGLCSLSAGNNEKQVRGTAKGDARVEHLFKLGAKQEVEALGKAGEPGLAELNKLLKQVVSNTNKTN